MSDTVHGSGPSLEAALSGAVADLLSRAVEDVDLTLKAPGLDELTGDFRFEVRVEAPSRAEPTVTEAGTGPAANDEAGSADEQPGLRQPREGGEDVGVTPEELDEEAEAAADFLEGLLDAMDLPGDLRLRLHDDHAEIEIVDVGSGALIGRRGQTLEAIQELVRCALQREFQRRSHVKVDVEGYRARRMEKLIEKAEQAIDEVLEHGGQERLEPMDVFERKAIHHLVAEVEGLESRSQGREPARRIVIEPTAD